MADIFLSYAREDLTKAKQLAAALEKQGWSVFWDISSILAGDDFDDIIEKAIDAAKCMVVLWSKASRNSNYVRDEARRGLNRNILVPILIEPIDPPMGFGSIHAVSLVSWKGKTDSPGYLALCKALTERIGPGLALASGAGKASQQSSSEPKKPGIRWSKQLAVIIGKIGVITVTLAILLWYVVPPVLVLLSQKDEPIPSKISSAELKVKNQSLVKEPEMVKIPAGSFQMGSNDRDYSNEGGYYEEMPVHNVIMKSFAIGRYEVTFDEYDQFAEAIGKPKPKDNGWGRGNRPVINVSWEDAVFYARWLSKKTGKHFRLPTEAEWEYAARAKTTSDYYWEGRANPFAWFAENSEKKTHPVGEKKPNTFGIYDTAGNVWEWLDDCWHENYENAPDDGSAWQEHNNSYCTLRVLRGGSWNGHQDWLRSANRFRISPGNTGGDIGFRLARD